MSCPIRIRRRFDPLFWPRFVVGLLRAQFFPIATVPNGGVGGRPVALAPCDRSSATNSVPEGRTQDGAEGRSPSPAFGANVFNHVHSEA